MYHVNDLSRLVVGYVVENVRADSKKGARVIPILQTENKELIATNGKSHLQVTSWRDDQGYYHVKRPDNDPHMEFLRYVRQQAEACAEDFLQTRWWDECKDKDVIEREIRHFLDQRHLLWSEIRKQIVYASTTHNLVDQEIRFQDQAIGTAKITAHLPYAPADQLTQDDVTKIVSVLDAFMVESEWRKLMWYVGAALTNAPIYAPHIAKALIISSKHGGAGKSTLMKQLIAPLFGPGFAEVDDLDRYFDAGNRFATGQLPSARLLLFNEANFGQASRDGIHRHNFTGFNISAMKSLITEGNLTTEEKHGLASQDRRKGLMIITTNYLPQIQYTQQDLTRRFITVLIKETTMRRKATLIESRLGFPLEAFKQPDWLGKLARFALRCYEESKEDYSTDKYDYEYCVDTISQEGTDPTDITAGLEEPIRQFAQLLIGLGYTDKDALIQLLDSVKLKDKALFIPNKKRLLKRVNQTLPDYLESTYPSTVSRGARYFVQSLED